MKVVIIRQRSRRSRSTISVGQVLQRRLRYQSVSSPIDKERVASMEKITMTRSVFLGMDGSVVFIVGTRGIRFERRPEKSWRVVLLHFQCYIRLCTNSLLHRSKLHMVKLKSYLYSNYSAPYKYFLFHLKKIDEKLERTRTG